MAGGTGFARVAESVADAAHLHQVYRLSDALQRAATLEEIYDLAVAGVMNATGATRAAILLLDDGRAMRFRASLGLSEAYRAAVEGHNPWEPDTRDPAPVLVPDMRDEPTLDVLRARIEAEGIRALAFVPIICNGTLVGKFMLYFDAPHEFCVGEIDLACAMAYHVGFALERKRSENRLRDERELFADGPVVVFKWRAEHDWPVAFVSANVERLTGYSREVWATGEITFKAILHPADADRVREEVWRHHAAGAANFQQEYRIIRADGEVRWVQDFTRVVRDQAGATLYFHGYLQDVTPARETRKKLQDLTATLESRVVERTAALEDACRELEAFSYSVSHDLRAPLRSIDGHAALLNESIGPRLTLEETEHFGRIRGAAQRMSTLIDDLLALSRISRRPFERCRIDLGRMANEVACVLAAGNPQRQVEWRIEEGMVVNGDPGLVRMLLECLLGNAWKFSSEREIAQIGLARDPSAQGGGFVVHDNGAGFDMRYAANLFAPFQRLHSAQQFPGVGIGLATAARIVRRHGGRISAIAAPEAGAQFYFTLPD